MLKKYCGWHKKYFGKELSIGEVPAESDGITTGICDDCRKLVAKEITVKWRHKGAMARAAPFGGHHPAAAGGALGTHPTGGNGLIDWDAVERF